MMIEQIRARDLRRMVRSGQVSEIVAVGLPGAWAVDICSDSCHEAAMTLCHPHAATRLHVRLWDTLDQLDHFLERAGITGYRVDRTQYATSLPAVAHRHEYFPQGPEEFLDHEFVVYVRRRSHHGPAA